MSLWTDRSQPTVSAGEAVVLPVPRGPLSEHLLSALVGSPRRIVSPTVTADDPMSDDDLQLALYCCNELHYRGLPGVDDAWEWEPSLVAFCRSLEEAYEGQLRAELPAAGGAAKEVPDALWAMTTDGHGPSLSGWLLAHGTRAHAEELTIHRSAYQLKEADPHTWGIPRLTGRAKAAMVTVQTDEYGNGVVSRMHASLFADAMVALGLDSTYGAYLDWLPAPTLATTNLITLFGLHRRLRGALVGHLALFEMTSVGPMGRYARWLESLGVTPEGRTFYDVHVTADEVHQYVAADDLVGGLLETEPELGPAVLFGAGALSLVESRFSSHLLASWAGDSSSLRTPGRVPVGLHPWTSGSARGQKITSPGAGGVRRLATGVTTYNSDIPKG